MGIQFAIRSTSDLSQPPFPLLRSMLWHQSTVFDVLYLRMLFVVEAVVLLIQKHQLKLTGGVEDQFWIPAYQQISPLRQDKSDK